MYNFPALHRVIRLVVAFVVSGACTFAAHAETQVTVYFINGIWNDQADWDASRRMLEQTINVAKTQRSPEYDAVQFNVIGLHNKSKTKIDDVNELRNSKNLEELYIESLKGSLLSGFAYTRVQLPNILSALVAQHLPLEIKSIQKGVDRGFKDLDKAVKKGKPVIIVAHSQGNIVANYIYYKFLNTYGNRITNNLKVVNIGNVARISPNDLDVTFCEDWTARQLLARLGWTDPRSTPWCPLGACSYIVDPGTVGADPNCPTPILPNGYHQFVEDYLSDSHMVSLVPNRSYIQTVRSRGDTSARARVLDAIYSAVDLIVNFRDPLSVESIDAQMWKHGSVESNLVGEYNLGQLGSSSIVAKTEFGEGFHFKMHACIPAYSFLSSASVHATPLDSKILEDWMSGLSMLPPIGIGIDYLNRGYLQLLVGDGAPMNVLATRNGVSFCGWVEFGIDCAQRGFVNFINDVGGETFSHRSGGKVPMGWRRLNAHQYESERIDINSLTFSPQAYAPPESSTCPN